MPAAGVAAALRLMASGELHRYGETGGVPSEASQLEQAFAQETGARYCVAMNSCGSTMFVALKAAGVKPGDRVLTNSFTLAPVPGASAHAQAEHPLEGLCRCFLTVGACRHASLVSVQCHVDGALGQLLA